MRRYASWLIDAYTFVWNISLPTAIKMCMICLSQYESIRSPRSPNTNELAMSEPSNYTHNLYNPNLFPRWKYIPNQLLLSQVQDSFPLHETIFLLFSAHSWPSRQASFKIHYTIWHLTIRGNNWVFSTIYLFFKKTTKIWFLTLTQSKQLGRKL